MVQDDTSGRLVSLKRATRAAARSACLRDASSFFRPSVLADKDFVDTLTVGVNGADEEAANDTYIPSTGDKPPHTHTINGSSVLWEFIGGTWQINYGDTSDVLLFTSPYAPEWDFATLSGHYLVIRQLPSPTPEPATLGLLIIGGLAMLRRRR